MTLLALAGRKPETQAWMTSLLAELGQAAAPIQRYGFWSRPDAPDPDVEPEIRSAGESGAGLVIAKSIGALIAMRARREAGLAAGAYVLIGAPVRRMAALGLSHLFADQARAAPTLFIQQTDDPTGAFAELALLLPVGVGPREVAGADHAYADVAALAKLIRHWPPWAVLAGG